MTGRYAQRYASCLAARSKLVVVLLLTAVVAGGATLAGGEDGGIGDFEVDSPETAAADYAEADYGTEETVPAQVVVRGESALGRESLLGIPFNSETATVTGLAIRLGVDYSIHAGERFVTERERLHARLA